MIKSFKQWINETNLHEQSTTPTTTTLKPTYDKPLCNNMSGTYGSGVETPDFKTCVYRNGGTTIIQLKDTAKGTILASAYGEDFSKANTLFFNKVAEALPGKRLGIELPMPIDPDNESASKYYKL